MEDFAIVQLYWDRDQNAITESDEKYGKYCHKIAWNILYNREDSDECVNDTWLKAWDAMPEERPERLGAFLGVITRNLSLDRYRRMSAEKRSDGQASFVFDEMQDTIGADGVEEQVDAIVLRDAINAYLASLPQEQRIIFVKRYWYMDSIEEIALNMGLTDSKVKSVLFRLRKKMGVYLKKEGVRV